MLCNINVLKSVNCIRNLRDSFAVSLILRKADENWLPIKEQVIKQKNRLKFWQQGKDSLHQRNEK